MKHLAPKKPLFKWHIFIINSNNAGATASTIALRLQQNQKSVWSSGSNRNKHKPSGDKFLARHLKKKYRKARVA